MRAPHKVIATHRYPIYIVGGAILLLGCVGYAITLLPSYFIAAKNLRLGVAEYNRRNYAGAIQHIELVLEDAPTSETAKIAIAKAYFANSDTEDDVVGLNYLQGLDLNEREWADINSIMPIEYQKYFSNKSIRDK